MTFCGTVRRAVKRILFFVFSSVCHIMLSSFCLYFSIYWLFIYSFLSKRGLETWCCVCGYCAYGLFLWFRLLRNNPKKHQGIRGGSWAILFWRQWVNPLCYKTVAQVNNKDGGRTRSTFHHCSAINIAHRSLRNMYTVLAVAVKKGHWSQDSDQSYSHAKKR